MIKYLLAAAALFATPAFADNEPDPILFIKTQDSGFVMPAYYQTFRCEVRLHQTIITRTFGQHGLQTVDPRNTWITAGSVQPEITAASAESLTDNGTLCDAPGTRITAHLETDGYNDATLLLFGQSTCAQDGERQGEHSTPLIALVNSLCGSM